jgi:hypothetical protein
LLAGVGGTRSDIGGTRRLDVIRESCSCGATFECAFKWASDEQNAVREWREKHKHEFTPPLPPVTEEEIMEAMGWTTIPTTLVKGPKWYEENHHWIWGEDGRVWIHATMAQPADFAEWDKRWPKEEVIEVKTDPEVYHKPMDVRPAMYDSPA